MGGFIQAGKSTAVETARAGGSAQQHSADVPGKQTLVPTGIQAVDNAQVPHHGSGYFLTAEQRHEVLLYRGLRINDAKTEFEGALGDVWADIAAESDTELNPIAGIVLNMIAGSASLALQAAAKSIMRSHAAEAVLSEAQVRGVQIGEEMSDVAESRLEVMVGSVIDQAKDSAKPGANAVTTATASDKSAKKAFLDALNEQVGDAYAKIREAYPDNLTDTDLLAEFDRWSLKYHRREAYRERIEKALKRYMGSKASKIGRKDAPQIQAHGGGAVKRELGVAWLQGSNTSLMIHTAGKVLAYIAQDFNTAGSDYQRAGAYGSTPMLSLGEDAHANDGVDGDITKAKPIGRPMFMGWVEDDLREAALAKHEAVWLQEPKTYTYGMLMYGGGPDLEVKEGDAHE
jgi:hypothetical protein